MSKTSQQFLLMTPETIQIYPPNLSHCTGWQLVGKNASEEQSKPQEATHESGRIVVFLRPGAVGFSNKNHTQVWKASKKAELF